MSGHCPDLFRSSYAIQPHFLTGSRGTLVGSAEGQRPFARRRPSRREISEGDRVQSRTPCWMPPHQPAASAERVWSPQRRSHKEDIRCLPRFLIEVPPAARGRGPLDPWLPWHVGFEVAESCRQERLPRKTHTLRLNSDAPCPQVLSLEGFETLTLTNQERPPCGRRFPIPLRHQKLRAKPRAGATLLHTTGPTR